MKLIATILNSSEKVLSRFVALGEGNVSTYDNLKKAPIGSTYLDRLNKSFYQKMSDDGSVSDWGLLGGSAPTKTGVFPMEPSEIVLDRPIYSLQSNVEVGLDDVVRGQLNHIEWEEFSSKNEEQSGYYVSLFVPLPEGSTSAKMQKDSAQEKVIDDGIIVLRIDDTTKSVKITITLGESETLTRTLDLSKLEKL